MTESVSPPLKAGGVDVFLEQLRTELVARSYRPHPVRHVAIPKGGGKTRRLSIPTIRDRVVQGAVKLILEPIFEADFQPGSYGYRPKRKAHAAVDRVATAIAWHKTRVVDLDLRAFFDTVQHDLLLQKVAKRVRDRDVLHVLWQMLKATGKRGVPQGGVISPLLSNLYVNSGGAKSRPRWRRKTRPPGRWAECLSAVVRTGWSGVWDRPWGGLRRSGNPCAQPAPSWGGGVRAPGRPRGGGPSCCVRGGSCRR